MHQSFVVFGTALITVLYIPVRRACDGLRFSSCPFLFPNVCSDGRGVYIFVFFWVVEFRIAMHGQGQPT